MVDETKQEQAESFASELPESDDTTIANNSETPEDGSQDIVEESKDILPIEEEEKPRSSAEVEKQKSVDATYGKVVSGQIDVEDIKQPWLKSLVERRLKAEDKTPDIAKIIDQKLAERESLSNFKSLSDELRKARLTNSQSQELQERYIGLRQKGLSKYDALETSMQLSGVDPQKTERNALRSNMTIPVSGRELPPESNDFASIKDINDPNKRIEKYEALRRKAKNEPTPIRRG